MRSRCSLFLDELDLFMQSVTPGKSPSWWHFGHVWLLIAGPVAVILAGIVTIYLAVSRPDPLVSEDYYRQGMELNKTLKEGGAAPSSTLVPAQQARNHAATGAVPAPKPAHGP